MGILRHLLMVRDLSSGTLRNLGAVIAGYEDLLDGSIHRPHAFMKFIGRNVKDVQLKRELDLAHNLGFLLDITTPIEAYLALGVSRGIRLTIWTVR
jgi:hypothetical protein